MDDEITLEDFEELTEGVVEETAVDETSEEFTEEITEVNAEELTVQE